MHPGFVVLTAALFSTLAACGGGEAEATGGVDKYLGTWQVCKSDSTNTSVRVTLTLRRISGDVAHISEIRRSHAPAEDCTGTLVATATDEGVLTYVDTKTTVRGPADRVIIRYETFTDGGKSIFAIRDDGKLYGALPKSDPMATVDGLGYPGIIDPRWGFVRQ
jgi:hypothetical protein